MSNQKICTLLRQLRKENNFDQTYLGKLLGKDQSYYSRLEAGEKDLTLSQAKILAKEYKIDLNRFWDLEDEGQQKEMAQDLALADEIEEKISLIEHLECCAKSKHYFTLFKAYILLCNKYGLNHDLQ